MDKRLTTITLVLCLFALDGRAQQAPDAYHRAITGTWTGTLEYRDYRSDGRVTLKTRLIVAPSADGLELAYTYDDGPGKTVRSLERVTIGADRESYRIRNGDGTYDTTFAAAGLRQFGSGSDQVVLVGKGTENDQPVDVRITIVATGNSLSMLRESRLAGADCLFRNEYRFTRDAGPGRR
jgi:hypothetical protein